MDLVFMLVVFGGGSALLAWGTMRLMRKAAERRDEVIEDLAPVEAETGRCGVCGGLGTVREARGARFYEERLVTCWRCGGTGIPA